jgi:hypothetical protein
MHAVEAQPLTGSPQIILRTAIKRMEKRAMIKNKTPATDAMARGFVENAIMPSRE